MRRRIRSSPAQKYVDAALSKAPADLDNMTPKLIPKLPDQAANSPVSKTHEKECKNFLKDFEQKIQAVSGLKMQPFSMLACILALPEELKDWPDMNTLEEVTSMILSDCGFLFDEVRPIVNGQLQPRDLITTLIPGEDSISKRAARDESNIISHELKLLYKRYRRADEEGDGKPRILYAMENMVEADFFRNCIVHVIEEGVSENSALELWRSRVPSEKLNEALEMYGDSLTIDDVLLELNEIHLDLIKHQNRAYEIFRSEQRISKEAYERFLKTLKNKEALWEKRIVKCRWNELQSELINGLKDVINTGDYYNGKPRREVIRLHQFNKLEDSWLNTVDTEKACQGMQIVFEDYIKAKSGSQVIQSIELMNAILKFSCNDVFQLIDMDDETAPTLAPIITYLIFKNYYRYIKTGKLSEMRINKLFSKARGKGNALLDIAMFERLCEIYETFYGMKCTPDIKREWETAFGLLSGYKDRYFCKREKELEFDNLVENSDRPINPWLSKVESCLAANRTNLLHSSISKRNYYLDHKYKETIDILIEHILAEDPAKKEIDRLLNTIPDGVIWIEEYRRLLLYPYPESSIENLLERCLHHLFIEMEDATLGDKCSFFSKQYNLAQLFPSNMYYPEMQCGFILEYCLRERLSQQCSARLLNWVDICIEKKNQED